MKHMQIWTAAMACIAVLAGAQAAVAGEQSMIPAQWRLHRFDTSSMVNATDQIQSPDSDQTMVPARWRLHRFDAVADASVRHQIQGPAYEPDVAPAWWREDRFDRTPSVADARDCGVRNREMMHGAC